MCTALFVCTVQKSTVFMLMNPALGFWALHDSAKIIRLRSSMWTLYTLKYFFLNFQFHISDIVYVGTIHPYHHATTMLALNNGKPVLCEKPMGMNYNQAKEMIDLAKQKKLFLMEVSFFLSLFFCQVVMASEFTQMMLLLSKVPVFSQPETLRDHLPYNHYISFSLPSSFSIPDAIPLPPDFLCIRLV